MVIDVAAAAAAVSAATVYAVVVAFAVHAPFLSSPAFSVCGSCSCSSLVVSVVVGGKNHALAA